VSAPGASAGVEFTGAKADLKVTIGDAGAVNCSLDVNGRKVRLVFGSGGDVDVDVEPQK
jgi:hypothetical protein